METKRSGMFTRDYATVTAAMLCAFLAASLAALRSTWSSPSRTSRTSATAST